MADPIRVSAPISGTDRELTLETGKLAPQSQGAVVASIGETRVLTTANAAKDVRPGIDFFPLTVDVEERSYAAGKIPGSFFRREGRPTEDAILTCRLTDRPLRPSFPDGFRNEVQIVTTVLGVDMANPHDVLSINAASAALMISGIPFDGPIGAVRVAYTTEGQWIPHPTYADGDAATFELVVAGRELDNGDVAVMMVEAGGTERSFYLYEDGAPKVDEAALAETLAQGRIMGAGLDVTEAEPNNTVADIANIQTLTPGQRGVGFMSTGSSATAERDLWKFSLTEPSSVTFQTTSGLTTPILADTTIRLMNADGTYGGIQATTGNTLAPSGSSHGRTSVRFNLTPGTYFLEVFGGTTTVSGNYTLEFGVMPSIYVDASYALVTQNASCLGTNGLRPSIAFQDFFTSRERPVLGAYFRRTIKDMPANAPYFFVQGFTTSAIALGNGGSTPLPLDLTTFGAVGCTLNVDIQNLRLGVANAAGSSEQGEVLTTNPVFRGLPVYEQAVVLDPTAPGNTLGITFSNYGRQIIGNRHWM